ncbi:MAG TPA: hydroxymethylpyrimidine/phosphomethylpyrimidine kinase [Crocinitomix sp.]|nr:hydroxymethylpyrimidine/phosphomethylpyrimidine kinase [Crocinitomix sp.]
MSKSLIYTLSIAGFDPSGGAGLLADIKTFEHFKCLGMAVQTANTIQTENHFLSVNWVDENLMLQQIETLLKIYNFNYIKIGLIKNIESLNKTVELCLSYHPKTKIIWDTILKTSTGFDFKIKNNGLTDILKKIYLITPNWTEIKQLANTDDSIEGAKILAQYTKVYLKGGHNQNNVGKDYLFEIQNQLLKQKNYNPKPTVKPITPKHGSGCVFSSALTANLSKGYNLHKSVLKSKRYTENYLSSNKTLLGTHKL